MNPKLERKAFWEQIARSMNSLILKLYALRCDREKLLATADQGLLLTGAVEDPPAKKATPSKKKRRKKRK